MHKGKIAEAHNTSGNGNRKGHSLIGLPIGLGRGGFDRGIGGKGHENEIKSDQMDDHAEEDNFVASDERRDFLRGEKLKLLISNSFTCTCIPFDAAAIFPSFGLMIRLFSNTQIAS